MGTRGLTDTAYVLTKLDWMRKERIWPNGLRYLWTDAFGVVLLASLHEALHEQKYLDEALWVVAEVKHVLGRKRGIRIGEEPDRDGQYSITSPCGSMRSMCFRATTRSSRMRGWRWRGPFTARS